MVSGVRCQGAEVSEVGSRNAEVGIGKLECGSWKKAKRLEHSVMTKVRNTGSEDRWKKWEVGPGVVQLTAELCRGYRCGSLKQSAESIAHGAKAGAGN